MKYIEQVTELGSGAKRLDILVVPGIFEGASYARAVAARLQADAMEDGPAKRIFKEFAIHLITVLPPGYHPDDEDQGIIPDNTIFESRIREAYASLPADSKKIVISHSWGGATFLSRPRWDGTKDPAAPDLAVLSAPAWSDYVGFASRLSGMLLAIPLAQYPARVLTRAIGCKTLLDSPLDEVRAIALGMPDIFSSRRVAYRSYRRALEGPCLCRHDGDSLRKLLSGSGKKVTIIQGTKDFALNGPGILAALESIGKLDDLAENSRVLRKDLNHWPLLEEPGLLGEIIEGGLLQPPD